MIKIEDTIKYFTSIVEREEVFVRKELLHLPREKWTSVPVYKKYRFCNVHRCYDKTFKLLSELTKDWGGLHPGLRTVLRWTANNELISFLIEQTNHSAEWRDMFIDANEASDPNDADPEPLFKAILNVVASGRFNLSTGSFIVKRYGNDLEEMLAYYKVGTRFWEKFVLPYVTDGIKCTSKKAVQFFKDNAPWCADFGAYCIVSDWLYRLPEMFTDIYDWTAYGPGAFNGINLIVPTTKREYLQHLKELHTIWKQHGKELLAKVSNDLDLSVEQIDDFCRQEGYLPMSKLLTEPLMLDVEHWLCEYAKYARGWAKKKY